MPAYVRNKSNFQSKQYLSSGPFEFQNWEVYRRSVLFIKFAKELAQCGQTIGIKNFQDQLTRASLSIPLNIAEGISRYGAKEKINFLRIAKGSLFECVACIDIMKSLQIIDRKEYQEVIKEMSEIGKMLSGLIRSVREREQDNKD
ncbi:four helix bundle protein [bacterium]|nr:four helix bundle protein [bacterium]